MLNMVGSMYCQPHMLNFDEELKKWLYVGMAQLAVKVGARVGMDALRRTCEGHCLELFRKPIEDVKGMVSDCLLYTSPSPRD